MNNVRIVLSALLVLSLSMTGGCGREKPRAGGDILAAEVNNYKMTVGDFKDEARFAMVGGFPAADAKNMKENIMDEIITRKVLVQEAQAQDFDKDKTFMKEIERYWEQALLKLLFKKKSEELSRAIDVSDSEVMDEYNRLASSGAVNPAAQPYEMMRAELKADIRNRKLQDAIDAWINGLRSKAKIKKYMDNLKDAE